jgi:hypothetical protein
MCQGCKRFRLSRTRWTPTTPLPLAQDRAVEEGVSGEDPSSPEILANRIARATEGAGGHQSPAGKRECPAPRRSAGPTTTPIRT